MKDEDFDDMIVDLQDYLRDAATKSYQAVPCQPFTLFFHPNDALIFFNYGIPDTRRTGDISASLPAVREIFVSRGRRTRFEFIEEYCPQLAAELKDSGFEEESRLHLMLCSREAFVPARPHDGLQIIRVSGQSSTADARDFLTTRSRGFEGNAATAASLSEAKRFLDGIARNGTSHFLARVNGRAVGVASYSTPMRGFTEIAGIAILEDYRGRGAGSALTSFALHAAFEAGVRVGFLSAADDNAGRIYQRLGFFPSATSLAYVEPQEPGVGNARAGAG